MRSKSTLRVQPLCRHLYLEFHYCCLFWVVSVVSLSADESGESWVLLLLKRYFANLAKEFPVIELHFGEDFRDRKENAKHVFSWKSRDFLRSRGRCNRAQKSKWKGESDNGSPFTNTRFLDKRAMPKTTSRIKGDIHFRLCWSAFDFHFLPAVTTLKLLKISNFALKT